MEKYRFLKAYCLRLYEFLYLLIVSCLIHSVLPVKMLASLALVLLVSSATEGRVLSKCELKEELEAVQIQATEAMGDKTTVDKFITRREQANSFCSKNDLQITTPP